MFASIDLLNTSEIKIDKLVTKIIIGSVFLIYLLTMIFQILNSQTKKIISEILPKEPFNLKAVI